MDDRVYIDVSKLDVCFGGFTPMALSDGSASREQVLQAQARSKARREARERAAEIERARASDVREHVDAQGTTWSYVVLDGSQIRIERCKTNAANLEIPEQIEQKPVVALAADACAYLAEIEQVACPDSVVSIGFCAFRGDKKLQRVAFPSNLADFDSDWLRGCADIEYLKLPGQLGKLTPRIFDIPNLRTLVVGAGTAEVEPGAFAKSSLETIEVDGANPYLMADGKALYRRDGAVMAALAVPLEEYQVREGCKAIAKKGFSTFGSVKRVTLPDGLQVLGEFAFSRTGITSFSAPKSLRYIMEKAFFNCADLQDVQLNEGLVLVADNAFTATGIHELQLPSSIEQLGNPIAARTALVYAGPDATFSIAKGSKHLTLDAAGGLYGEEDGGKHLIRIMNPLAQTYAVEAGTVAIDENAFINHAHISQVSLPNGLAIIGKAAFRACRKLAHVNIPEGILRIEEDAFLDTNIESLQIPASLEYVGPNALVTYDAHHGDAESPLHDVSVDPLNKRFFADSGLLLEHKDKGGAVVLLCAGSAEQVRIPEEVDEIAPYAFNGVSGIRELILSDRIARVGVRGLAINGLIDHIHIDLAEPISHHNGLDLYFPESDRSTQQMMLALSVPDHVDAAILFAHYDNAIINRSSFDAENESGLDVYEQVTRIVERLLDPVLLSTSNRSMCDRILSSNIEDICVEIARHDDRKTIDALLDLGYLNADNLYAVIDRISALQDAAMTDYLLEAKRRRFKQDALDFDL